jgi:hypothetical protein
VSRTDRGLEDLGKVAEIVDSQSPLKIGLKGEFRGHKFELTGRAQNRHELGGVWDEWYATFGNGWVGWLAEAQGKFYLTFYQPLPAGAILPPYDSLSVGQPMPEIPNKSPLMVIEKGVATSVAAAGEIPYRLTPNERSEYADLSGKDNAFGTIDYSMNPPWVFVGQQVTLEDIGLAQAKPVIREAARVSTQGMGCPKCGGALSLNAPDKTERVTCPYCNSLLDVNQGKLSWFKSLTPPASAPDFVLKVGMDGTFNGVLFKIIGAVVRSVTIDGVSYYWHEYLLYNPMVGFRWLIHSDNHWNFVETVNPAEIEIMQPFGFGGNVKYNGQAYKIFQDAEARVEYVTGEFYWRVEQGETVRAIDYVAAPLMLSQEQTANEVNWSIGVYQTNAEVESAFNIADLPKPWSVAPNQPFTGGFYIKWGLAFMAGLFVIAIAMIPLGGFNNTPLNETVTLAPTASATTPQVAFSQQFTLKSNRNVRITAQAPVSNSWADLDVDLVNEQNNEVESVSIPIEYYSGTDSDGSWTEGSTAQDATLSALPGGKYTLRVEGTWQNFGQPMPVGLKVEQNVSRGVNFCCALIVIAILPLLGIIRKFSFESKRWSESMFGSAAVTTGDDE